MPSSTGVIEREKAQARVSGTSLLLRDRGKRVKRHWQLYLLVLLPLAYLFIFKYIPMYGAQIAFRDFSPVRGFFGSEWVGLTNFTTFFKSPNFWILIKNTLVISIYSLLIGFPAPIILALALNEVRSMRFKRIVQMVTFAPYFISTIVMVSMIILFLSPRLGFIDHILRLFGMEAVNYMGIPSYFSSIFVWSNVWQGIGYGAVIYLAALAGINTDLYEAARVDGASRIQKVWHIDIPGIMPAAIILLILNVGQIMNVGFEKIYLMQNPLNTSTSEVISTYVYKIGLLGANFSFSAAVDLFNSVINLILLLSVNYFARRISDSSLW
ncbi:sugar ABC transporter permease [Paenibacillus sp. CF384]|uniref:ABC transporter permease n=1 Tax=Paenibacillus sp. CF384 TaxID=1884382 RepID=UPI000895F005|nr:ABC transporter permease subunit [Paenibacillus sp. CF384]SDX70765.1 carbohydrate ABC transporter membrane protein 1, CUT1 family [Paenibacillus sp. CF384]